MDPIAEYNERIPDYALPYLINADDSGLTSQDKTIVDNYMQFFYTQADNNNANVIIGIDNLDSDPYFTWRPAFGLACNVMDCTILILKG